MGCTTSATYKDPPPSRRHSLERRTPFKPRERQLSFLYTTVDADGNPCVMTSFGTKSKVTHLLDNQVQLIDDPKNDSDSPEYRVNNPLHPDHKHLLSSTLVEPKMESPVIHAPSGSPLKQPPRKEIHHVDDIKTGDDDYEEARRSTRQSPAQLLASPIPVPNLYDPPNIVQQKPSHFREVLPRAPPDFKKAKERQQQLAVDSNQQSVLRPKMESISSRDYYSAHPQQQLVQHEELRQFQPDDHMDEVVRFTPLFSPDMKFDFDAGHNKDDNPSPLQLVPSWHPEYETPTPIRTIRYHKGDITGGNHESNSDYGEEWIASPRSPQELSSPTKDYPNLHLLFDPLQARRQQIISPSPDLHSSTDDYCFESTPIVYPVIQTDFDIETDEVPSLSVMPQSHPQKRRHSRRKSTKRKSR